MGQESNIEQKMGQLHCELLQWRSTLDFMSDEVLFIDRLLNSYVFQPKTRNLFERLQDYLHRLRTIKKQSKKIYSTLEKHDQDLGGMLECDDMHCDTFYDQEHEKIKAVMTELMENFKILKGEIFNYAGGILRGKKP